MCLPLDISCHAAEAAAGATGSLLDVLVEAIREAIGAQIVLAVTWWVRVPSPDVTNPAETLQRWMLPFTALVATGGILWQALLMIVTRKGEPLVNVVKGLAAVALWGAVAVAGTNLLLRFGEAYSVWVLTQGLDGNIDSLADRMAALLVPASAAWWASSAMSDMPVPPSTIATAVSKRSGWDSNLSVTARGKGPGRTRRSEADGNQLYTLTPRRY